MARVAPAIVYVFVVIYAEIMAHLVGDNRGHETSSLHSLFVHNGCRIAAYFANMPQACISRLGTHSANISYRS